MKTTNWREEYDNCVMSGDIKEAKQIVRDNVGDLTIRKFFPGTRQQLETVMSSKFWLSNAKHFNDPFDSLSLANVRTQSVYDRYNPKERELAYQEYKRQVASNNIAYDFQSNVFVTCFSEIEYDNIHMWSYYADEHKGFCVEYLLREMLDKDINILPVVYTNVWQANRDNANYNEQVALIKGESWAHEKEWRIVNIDPVRSQEPGILLDGVLPIGIYIGCRDEKHIKDSWDLYYELQKALNNPEGLTSYVWYGPKTRITLNEVLNMCETFYEKKIPIFSMYLAEGRLSLKKSRVEYLWKPSRGQTMEDVAKVDK